MDEYEPEKAEKWVYYFLGIMLSCLIGIVCTVAHYC